MKEVIRKVLPCGCKVGSECKCGVKKKRGEVAMDSAQQRKLGGVDCFTVMQRNRTRFNRGLDCEV